MIKHCFYILFIFLADILSAQTLETGIGINETHLWQGDSYNDGVERKEGFGVSLMARYQNPIGFFLFRNNEAGFEYSQGGIHINQHTSPGGAGGDITDITYSNLSFTLNNYLINFKTINKPLQFSMGLHYNYKLLTKSEGQFTHQKISWNFMYNQYNFSYLHYDLSGINNKYISKFNLGICMGLGFRPISIGSTTIRSRYDACATLGSEINDGLGFGYLRQRFTISILFGNMGSRQILEKQRMISQKKERNRKNRKKYNAERLAKLPLFLDKNLEFGIGTNFYHFKLGNGDGSKNTLDAGIGFGIRVWDWKTKRNWPAVSLNFQQVNYNIYYWFLFSPISGQFQRNTLSLGIYPLKILIAKKRIDIRGGLDVGVLLSNKAKGIYQQIDMVDGNLLKHERFSTDKYGFNKKATISPILTIAGPVIRRNEYCLKWRFTTAYNIADMKVDGINGHGWRYQTEVVYCKKLF